MKRLWTRRKMMIATAGLLLLLAGNAVAQQPAKTRTAAERAKKAAVSAKPKLVVVIVVDQMRADYVDKFQRQWSSGLKRLLKEGAWFTEAAYPYADTETCVGHSTISTGAFPAAHGMISNEWWDREFVNGKDANGNEQPKGRKLPCTYDPNAKDSAYGGLTTGGKDSGARLAVPTLSDEMRFQLGAAATRVVTFSLKARAAIALGGHRADAVTWFDSKTGALATSNVYGSMPFVEDFARANPVSQDYGKTWVRAHDVADYQYDEKAYGAYPPDGWGTELPHTLGASSSKDGSTGPDAAFFVQWSCSPFSDRYLERLAEASVDSLGLGQGGGTDFLGVGFSALDYAGHAFGPRSHEIQDVLIQLDETLGRLLAHLDEKVGKGNYVVALTADHGVAPIPEDFQQSGTDAGWIYPSDVQSQIEAALAELHYATEHPVANASGSNIYFTPEVAERLRQDQAGMAAVKKAILGVDGVDSVFFASEVMNRPATENPKLRAVAAGFVAQRSGDVLIVPKPYWEFAYGKRSDKRTIGTVHGTPYYYDQRVPILLMGWGIKPGRYSGSATPADIAPTLASLCGITLAPHDGRALAEALMDKTAAPAPKP